MQRRRWRLDRAAHCAVRPDSTFGKGITSRDLQLHDRDCVGNTVIDDADTSELFQTSRLVAVLSGYVLIN